ncbi:MAG: transcription elongation factor GreA [Ignavibacteriae bacterium]|nr:transcription elongation factor GreA [Ignavibacteriota bacterium]NOG98934.1 transcription elongation factor GreA [Ignavibacteriota bacterium]
MSRGFVKEGDQEETPLVTPRAHLPAGVLNYVTPNGLKELEHERNLLVEERKTLIEQDSENNRVQINYITAKLGLLEERISSAKLVELSNQPQNKVYFGATITLYKTKEDCESQYQIVGVDEADVSKNKVSFLSPIAKALINKKVGDEIILQTPKGKRFMKIEAIDYK